MEKLKCSLAWPTTVCALHSEDHFTLSALFPDPTGTAITTALSCVRRAWLSERIAAAGGGPGAAATRGTLLHELLQRLLVEVVGADAEAELPGVQQLEQMVSE